MNIKKYGMFRHYDDSQKFLEDHLELVCEETANYLVVWCIDLEMEEVRIDMKLFPMNGIAFLSLSRVET